MKPAFKLVNKIIWYENRITVEICRVSFIVFSVGLLLASPLNLNSCSAIVSHFRCFNEYTVKLSWVILSLIPVASLSIFIVWLYNNLAILDVNPNKNWAQFKSTRNGELNIIASVINLQSPRILILCYDFQTMNYKTKQCTKIKTWSMSFNPSCVAKKLDFLRYIFLIPFSTAPLLKDSTHFSSNSYYLGEYLNKILIFFL